MLSPYLWCLCSPDLWSLLCPVLRSLLSPNLWSLLRFGVGAHAPLTSPCPPSNHTITINLTVTFAANLFGHASHVDWAEQDPPNFVHGCFCHIIALRFGPQHSLQPEPRVRARARVGARGGGRGRVRVRGRFRCRVRVQSGQNGQGGGVPPIHTPAPGQGEVPHGQEEGKKILLPSAVHLEERLTVSQSVP